MEAATSSCSATDKFLQYIYSIIIRSSDQGVLFMNFPSQIFLTILIMVTKQLYWRKILCGCFRFIWMWLLIAIMKRHAERWTLQLYHTSLSIFILFQLQSWIILRVEVFAQELSYEDIDYGDSDDEDIKQLYIWLVK